MKIPAPATLLCTLFLATALTGAAQTSSSDAKTYTLFEGDNIMVGQANGLHTVRDVNGGSWVIVVDGEQQLVSAKNGPISMKVTPAEKLTDVTATISGLRSERGYTFANDPAVKLTKNLNNGAIVNIGEHTAANQSTAASNAAIAASNSGVNKNNGEGAQSPGNTSPSSNQAKVDSDNNQTYALNNAGGDLSYLGDGGDYDALEVSFDITAAKELKEPYFVVITNFRDKDAPPGASQNLIYAKALEPVSGNVEHVKFEQGGFPLGYQLISFELHLYDNGVEVATNISPKRSTLSAEEAFNFVRTKYIGAHKGETLPASPVMGKLPDDFASHLAEGKYSAPIFVKVSKDGTANGAFSDASCTAKIDDTYLDSVVSGIRFKPALAQGNPVEGVASLNLSQLRI
jgi:hypothetical protein